MAKKKKKSKGGTDRKGGSKRARSGGRKSKRRSGKKGTSRSGKSAAASKRGGKRGKKAGGRARRGTAGGKHVIKRKVTHHARRHARDAAEAEGLTVGARGLVSSATPGDKTEIYRGLRARYDEIDELSRKVEDAKQKQRLRDQRDRIGEQADALLGKIIDEATREYRAATAALKDAEERITAALADAGKASRAIAAVAKLIDAVVSVLA